MFGKRRIANGLIILSFLGQNTASSEVKFKRPPQYVLLAYDGSYNNDMWEKTRAFSQEQKVKWSSTRKNGDDIDIVKFTYFINPAFLLNPPKNKAGVIKEEAGKLYAAPGKRYGTSNVGWGDSAQDISDRLDQMNAAFAEGHEIGSHTVGHFDGSKFSYEDWKQEFREFNKVLDKVFEFNKIPSRELPFKFEIIGFRAPVLGVNGDLYQTLKDFNFKYDTSKLDAVETKWPQKDAYGTWLFPLAALPDQGARYGVPSMDYNFCFRDSLKFLGRFDVIPGEPKEVSNQKRAERKKILKESFWDPETEKYVKNKHADCLDFVPADYKKEVKVHMKKLYKAYFDKNYYGNRAPLHIGHHFSRWMSGAYREALFEFADQVCHLPEVKCVTYKEFMQFMDSRLPSEIASYQKTKFEPFPKPPQAKSLVTEYIWDLDAKLSIEEDSLEIIIDGRDSKRAGLKKYISVNGSLLEVSENLPLKEIRNLTAFGETTIIRLIVKNKLGKEVLGASYKIENIGTENEHVNLENLEKTMADNHCEADGSVAESER